MKKNFVSLSLILIGMLLVCAVACDSTVYRTITGGPDPYYVPEPVEPIPTPSNYIKFEGNDFFSLSTVEGAKTWDGTIEYSTGSDWVEWDGTPIASNSYNKLYLRGSDNTVISNGSRFVLFDEATEITCTGNIECLLDYETVAEGNHPVMADSCFNAMFKECEQLTVAPQLPGETLAEHCYESMFEGCTSLKAMPELPATSSKKYCYYKMFKDCTALTDGAKIALTTFGEYDSTNAIRDMFNGCTNFQICKSAAETDTYKLLVTIPADLNSQEKSSMFAGCNADSRLNIQSGTPAAGNYYYKVNSEN